MSIFGLLLVKLVFKYVCILIYWEKFCFSIFFCTSLQFPPFVLINFQFIDVKINNETCFIH